MISWKQSLLAVAVVTLGAGSAFAEPTTTPTGTIIWKAPENANAAPSMPAPAPSNKMPDKNGIIWNDAPRAAAGDGAAASGRCREIETEIVVEGQHQKIHGTACQEPDGRWRVTN